MNLLETRPLRVNLHTEHGYLPAERAHPSMKICVWLIEVGVLLARIRGNTTLISGHDA